MTGHRGLIDVHAHFVPDAYRHELVEAGHSQPDGFPLIPAWSAEEHVAALDRLGVRTALLSISSPGVHFGDDGAARALARTVNDAGREAVARHPGRFGLLASLPLPDVDGALAEVAHALDDLGADGIALLTHTEGCYLGDAALEPVMEELDRRAARVFIHPTSPPCAHHTSLDRPRPMIEFLFDTSRAVTNLVLNGVVARHRNIEWIVPHAGATLPVLADRVAAFSTVLPDIDPAADVLRDLARLHYDLAGFPLPRQLDALLTIATMERLHYGSDYPFTPLAAAVDRVRQLASVGDEPGMLDHLATNTRALFPRLAGAT